MRMIPLIFLSFTAAFAQSTAASNRHFLGAWEGESKCTVPDSPCHDEHVVYEVKARADAASIDMYKVVSGEKQFMGTVECKKPEERSMSCTIPESKRKNEWIFTLVEEKALQGTLYMDEARTIYRQIRVARK